MLFNSLTFALFFPAAFLAWRLTARRHRWAVLLVASYAFYMGWRPEYALLIAGSTILDFVCARRIFRSENRTKRIWWLVASLSGNLFTLGTFKYLGMAAGTANAIYELLGGSGSFVDVPHLVLPVGISFYTFQTIGYTIDVYRRNRAPETHFGHFALYVAYFPQLVAGPIERSDRLLPQLKEPRNPSAHDVTSGLQLVLIGLFKKLVVADRLALFVDQVYADPTGYTGLFAWIVVYAFAVQIYCDFSGYSDIAIGVARCFGVDLMVNFKRPYFATSLRDFWRRWHISLSTWFRDYVYFPLGGSQSSAQRTSAVTMVVFTLSGLWHGASWAFVVWGVLHGAACVVERHVRGAALSMFPARVATALGWFFTLHVVALLWVPFRAADFGVALTLWRNLFVGIFEQMVQFSDWQWSMKVFGPFEIGLSKYECVVAALSVATLFAMEFAQTQKMAPLIRRAPPWIWHVRDVVLLALVLLFATGGENAFIYFQF